MLGDVDTNDYERTCFQCAYLMLSFEKLIVLPHLLCRQHSFVAQS